MAGFIGKNGFVWFQGVVEDVLDPLKLGRVRVRCLGFHSKSKVDIPTESLPWATPLQPISSAAMNGIGESITGLLPGTWVMGFFRDGEMCQEPVVMGSIGGIPQEEANTGMGFSDPSGTYPKTDFIGEADTNRLARNEQISNTIVQIKKSNIETGVLAALNAETWSEPETPYNAVYPKNHVKQTESGHIQEFDDTPNSERIHTYHKSGTFEEIHPDGSVVYKIVANNYEIVLQDDKLLVKENKSENVVGNSNLQVGGNLNIQVEGSVNLLVKGNTTLETRGDHFHKVTGVYAVVSEGNMIFSAPRIDLNPNGTNPSDIGNPF